MFAFLVVGLRVMKEVIPIKTGGTITRFEPETLHPP